jgi:hypothetical protein
MQAQSGTASFEQSLKEQEEFASRPEVQAIVKAQMEAHWEGWYDEPVPALQNKTPREAARTKAGRAIKMRCLSTSNAGMNKFPTYLRVDLEAIRRKRFMRLITWFPGVIAPFFTSPSNPTRPYRRPGAQFQP